MAAKDIVEAFEKEYEMSFLSNPDRARDFTNGWCAAKAAGVEKPTHSSESAPCPTCGAACTVGGDDEEGTRYFIPVVPYRAQHQ